jgi:LEA14-like dessication related protein
MRHIFLVLPLCFLSLACSAIRRPTASFRSMAVQNVDSEGFTMNFDLMLNNPNAVSLPLSNADYKLSFAGIKVLDGQAKPEGSIPANGSLALQLPVKVTYENLLAAEQAIASGNAKIPYAFDGGLSVGGGGGGQMLLGQSARVPLNYSGTLDLSEILSRSRAALTSPAARKLAAKALGSFLFTVSRNDLSLART